MKYLVLFIGLIITDIAWYNVGAVSKSKEIKQLKNELAISHKSVKFEPKKQEAYYDINNCAWKILKKSYSADTITFYRTCNCEIQGGHK